jgi:hypothetical protein
MRIHWPPRLLERSDALLEKPGSRVLAFQRESGPALRSCSRSPVAIRHLTGLLRTRPPPAHAFHGRVNVADIEVVKTGNRHRRRHGHHATDRLPAGGELLICAHRADVGFRFFPAKELAVKGPRFLRVGGEEFVPGDAAACARANGLLLTGALPLEQRKRCHLRVRDD